MLIIQLLVSRGPEYWLEQLDDADAAADMTPAVASASANLLGEYTLAGSLEKLTARYQQEIETFEGMIVLAADDMAEKEAEKEAAEPAAQPTAAARAPAAKRRTASPRQKKKKTFGKTKKKR